MMKARIEPMEHGLREYLTGRRLKIWGVVIPSDRGHHPSSLQLVAPCFVTFFPSFSCLTFSSYFINYGCLISCIVIDNVCCIIRYFTGI